MKTKKTFYERVVKPIGIGFLIMLVGALIMWFINNEIWKNDAEGKMHSTAEIKTEAENWLNTKPNDVQVFRARDTLQKTLDTTKLLQIQILKRANAMDSFYRFAQNKFTKDSLTELSKDRSRAGRDSTNKVQAETMREILKLLKDKNQ